jgi:glycerol-3-phosphate acyltransferase PlsX
LGLSGAIVKAHGSSDANAITNAIRQARRFVEQTVISQISGEIRDDRRE